MAMLHQHLESGERFAEEVIGISSDSRYSALFATYRSE
jgi:hypothetical protein